MIKNILFIALIMLPLHSSLASALSLEEQRQTFIKAEKLIRKADSARFFSLLDTIKDYPLYPYIQYQWLKNNLKQTKKVKTFLHDNKNTRYAGLLHYKWQIYLAKHKRWSEFIKSYKANNKTKLQCYYFQAKYNTGHKKEALIGAKKLWVVGKSQPNECDPIFKALKNSKYFTNEMLWQRFESALRNGKLQLARYVLRSMTKKDQRVAGIWLKVYSNPSLIVKKDFLNKTTAQSGLIFAQGIYRLAGKNISQAISLWDARKQQYKINSATLNYVEERLAMSLAYRRDLRAYQRLSHLVKPSDSAKEWRIRAALREQNWQQVKQAIMALDKESREKGKWSYWLARAYENTEKPKPADFIFSKLAKERSFYGYLSAEKLNKDYKMVNNPIVVAPKAYERLKRQEQFRVVVELIAVNKVMEARRQWWYVISKLNKSDILMAAKYAEELKWKQVAIYTIAKAKYWDDVSVRFPLAYKSQVQKNAQIQQLNPAIIYGLIRRESAFNKTAQSPVGARGLMQIMPKTGQQIARELKEKWKTTNSLFNADTNVKYGSYYYKKLLNQFDGNYALAAAAYNAGPHRVKRWLPTDKPLAADIWVETIPFKETRGYVSAVLTYALIYQNKLKKSALTMKNLMREVFPG